MTLSEKKFEIKQLVENREEFVVFEFLYILGINISYTYYSLDGNCGDIPYNYLSSAEDKLKELEQLEEFEQPFRSGSVMLLLIILAVVLFGIYKLMF